MIQNIIEELHRKDFYEVPTYPEPFKQQFVIIDDDILEATLKEKYNLTLQELEALLKQYMPEKLF